MKKSISIILAILMCFSCFSIISFAEETDSDHITTVPEGYVGIYTIEDLYCVRNDLTANYILMNNIDLSEATAKGGDWNYGGRGWNPIGSNDTYSCSFFSGIFNGNGFCITGMNILITKFLDNSYDHYLGLFAGLSGTIENLTIEGKIKISRTNTTLVDEVKIGGIVAYSENGTIRNCTSRVNIEVSESHQYYTSSTSMTAKDCIGGIVGKAKWTNISECRNTGNINGSLYTKYTNVSSGAYVGGIVGYCYDYSSSSDKASTVERCTNTATINFSLSGYFNGYFGGIIGYCFNNSAITRNCFNTANITTSMEIDPGIGKTRATTYVGGINGYYGKIISCYNIGTITGTYSAAIASKAVGHSKKSYYLKETGSNTNEDFKELTDEEMMLKTTFASWDFDTVWTMEGRPDYPYPELKNVPLIFPDETISHDHNYTSEVTTPSTHLTEGVMTYSCVCGNIFFKAIAKTTEHTYSTVITAPTCTNQGYTTYTCECGDTYIDDFIKENGHSHTSTVTTPASHLTEGLMTYTCTCGDTYTEAIAKTTEHTHTAVVTAPTCTEQGYTTYTCECGDTYVDNFVKENGHSHTAEVTTPATHLAEGIITYTCACGDTYTEAIAKTTEHTYNTIVTAPTCTDRGFTLYFCACNDFYMADYVEANGHSHTATVTTPATHLTEGVMTYTCTCGDTYTEAIAKTTEHTYSAVVTPPTCTEQGYTTYTCVCGDTYVSDYVKENGHSHTATVTIPATHLTEGVMTCTCACGDTYTEVIAKTTEHTFTEEIIATPTCTAKGKRLFTCECGYSYTDEIAKTSHVNTNGDYSCDICGNNLCSHMCHKSGFMGFIWKLINFFSKLFGTNPVCECGVAHY